MAPRRAVHQPTPSARDELTRPPSAPSPKALSQPKDHHRVNVRASRPVSGVVAGAPARAATSWSKSLRRHPSQGVATRETVGTLTVDPPLKSSSRAATLPNPRIVANPPSAAITGAGGSAGWHGSQPHVLPRCDCSVLLRHRLIRVALFSDVTGGEWRCCLAQVCADWSCTPNRPLGQTAYGTFTRVVWNCVFGCLCARMNVLVVGRGVAHSTTYVRTRSQKSGAQ